MDRIETPNMVAYQFPVSSRLRPFLESIRVIEIKSGKAKASRSFENPLSPEGYIKFSLAGAVHYRDETNALVAEGSKSFLGSNSKPLTRILPESGGTFIVADATILGLSAGLGISASETAEGIHALRDLMGPVTDEAYERMASASSPERRFSILHDALLSLNLKAPPPALLEALSMIYRSKGSASIETVARSVGVSMRTLRRFFSHWTGMGAKELSAITRMRWVVESIRDSDDFEWADTAYRFGFHDQAHLIHSFQSATGETPSGFLERMRVNSIDISTPTLPS